VGQAAFERRKTTKERAWSIPGSVTVYRVRIQDSTVLPCTVTLQDNGGSSVSLVMNCARSTRAHASIYTDSDLSVPSPAPVPLPTPTTEKSESLPHRHLKPQPHVIRRFEGASLTGKHTLWVLVSPTFCRTVLPVPYVFSFPLVPLLWNDWLPQVIASANSSPGPVSFFFTGPLDVKPGRLTSVTRISPRTRFHDTCVTPTRRTSLWIVSVYGDALMIATCRQTQTVYI